VSETVASLHDGSVVMSGVKRCVAAFATGGKVTAEETEAALTDIMAGAATPSQVGAFLLGE